MKKTWVIPGIIVVLLAVLVWAFFPRQATAPQKRTSAPPVYPLKISDNGRYLADQNNIPFLIKMDTGWQLAMRDANAAYITEYLDDRAAKGFNAVLITGANWNPTQPNDLGAYPFGNPPNMETPNDAFFDNLGAIIQKCADRGMLVFLNELNWQGGYEHYLTEATANSMGQYFGKRYKDMKNIIYVHGGDSSIIKSEDSRKIYRAVAAGIKQYDTTKLQTYHIGWNTSTSDFFMNEPWLDFNMYQSFSAENTFAYTQGLDDYNNHGSKPTFFVEPCYDYNVTYGTIVKPYHIRQATGWGILSGSAGCGYGNMRVFRMEPNVMERANPPGIGQYVNIMDMVGAYEWQKLVPDSGHAMLTAGYGTYKEIDYATAALADDGSFGIVYLPDAREITVDLSKFSGRVTAKWFDPTNGTYKKAGTYKNSDTRKFAAQPKNNAGDSDWFLILETK